MVKDVKIPEISENVTSGNIVDVLVAVGDTVAVDDVLVEMETEKAVVEIPSPYAGEIREILAKAGEEKNVGDVIARIEVSDADAEEDQTDETPGKADAGQDDKAAESVEDGRAGAEKTTSARPSGDESGTAEPSVTTESPEPQREAEAALPAPREDDTTPPAPAAPSVRRMARELGVDIHDVHGSGLDGRISQEDVHAYVKQRFAGAPAGRGLDGASAGQPVLPDFSRWGTVRTEKLATVRRLTAENTSVSWRMVPQVTQFDEADITGVQAFLDRYGRQAEQKGGKLTLTAILMKVCAVALQRYPGFNASIDLTNDRMIYKDYVHIGMAVDTPRGLLVPVIRDVQDKGIIDLAVGNCRYGPAGPQQKDQTGRIRGGQLLHFQPGRHRGDGFYAGGGLAPGRHPGDQPGAKKIGGAGGEYRDPYDPAAVRLLRSPDRGRGRCGAVFGLYLQESGAGADAIALGFPDKGHLAAQLGVLAF